MSRPTPKLRWKLDRIGACRDARRWADNRDPRESWLACERPDWMLWLVGQLAPGSGKARRRWLVRTVRTAVDLARPVLTHVPAGDPRACDAVDLADRWCDEPDSVCYTELRAAAYAADTAADAAAYAARAAAYAADTAADAAAYAARAAAYAADAAADAEADAAADAADAAADAEADAAADADIRRDQCRIIRRRWQWRTIRAAAASSGILESESDD